MLLNKQEQFNRVNTTSPFGSQTYGVGADGQRSFNTTLSPQMQALMERGMGMAGSNLERSAQPAGMESLISALMARVSNRTGAKK